MLTEPLRSAFSGLLSSMILSHELWPLYRLKSLFSQLTETSDVFSVLDILPCSLAASCFRVEFFGILWLMLWTHFPYAFPFSKIWKFYTSCTAELFLTIFVPVLQSWVCCHWHVSGWKQRRLNFYFRRYWSQFRLMLEDWFRVPNV